MSNKMKICCDYLAEQIVWTVSFFEGFIIGFCIRYETLHHKRRREHDFIVEMEHGFEKGLWVGEL